MRRIVGCIVTVMVFLVACHDGETERQRESLDSLNRCAYDQHYRSTDSTEMFARQVLEACAEGDYTDARNEALCHLAFAKAMQMEYDTAQVVYRQVLDGEANELLKLVADVGMMRICQRRSANKDFYDYSVSAERRMKRIAPEENLMTDTQRRLWNYAQSDYHLTLSIYYYYVRQEQRALEEIDIVGKNLQWVENDPQQLAFFYFLGGNARSTDKVISEDNMRHILRCLSVAYYNRHPYLYSKALTSLADDMIQTGEVRPGRANYLRELLQIPDSVEEAD